MSLKRKDVLNLSRFCITLVAFTKSSYNSYNNETNKAVEPSFSVINLCNFYLCLFLGRKIKVLPWHRSYSLF